MNGNTSLGNVFKGTTPASPSVEKVPSAKSLVGQTNQGLTTVSKLSETAGFSASKRAGSVKGSLA